MPTNKDFKRLVRARMERTGEAYTAARANLLKRHATPSISAPVALVDAPPPAKAAKPDYARLAGMSDAAIKKVTGCDWDKWVFCLDYVGAQDWSHRAITDHVHTAYKVKDWWTQAVTVGYERIKGLRAIGCRVGELLGKTLHCRPERLDGGHQVDERVHLSKRRFVRYTHRLQASSAVDIAHQGELRLRIGRIPSKRPAGSPSTPDPRLACKQLIALANEAGGHDNVTVIVARYEPIVPASPRRHPQRISAQRLN